MPTPAQVAHAHYRRRRAIARQAALAAAALWQAVEFANLDASWAAVSDRAVSVLTASQYAAASSASEYVTAQARAQSLTLDPSGDLSASAFSGRAADGRALAQLLRLPIIDVKVAVGAGMSRTDSMTRGLGSLTTYMVNETTQAGSNADHVGLTNQRTMTGYVRILTPPSCSRCTILAGKYFRWNSGFQRHPHCDCVHLPTNAPATVADAQISPRAAFDDLSRDQQDRIFGKDAARAIRDGADMGQVVNARRGMTTFDSSTTSEGTTVRRGIYGSRMATATGQLDPRLRALNGRWGGFNELAPKSQRYAGVGLFETSDVARLTVRRIYELAGDDRSLALELLRRYAYLT